MEGTILNLPVNYFLSNNRVLIFLNDNYFINTIEVLSQCNITKILCGMQCMILWEINANSAIKKKTNCKPVVWPHLTSCINNTKSISTHAGTTQTDKTVKLTLLLACNSKCSHQHQVCARSIQIMTSHYSFSSQVMHA